MASFNDYRKSGFTIISNNIFKYYAQLHISETELVLILQLEAFSQSGNHFPSNQSLASVTNLSSIEVSELLQSLINKELISLEQINDSEGRISNFYSLDTLYTKLDKLVEKNSSIDGNDTTNKLSVRTSARNPVQEVIRQFEIEFGRLLSPIERQEVAAWVTEDHYDPEVIKLALREAVLAQVYNFKYVDRILLNWQRHSLTTVDQVKNFLQRNV